MPDVPAVPSVPLPLGSAITQVPTRVAGDTAGTFKNINVPTTFNTNTADYFSVYGPLLTPFTDISTVDFKKLTPIPVGTPISVSALSPPLGTSLPTSAAAVPLSAPATVRWRIQSMDFSGDATAASPAASGLTDQDASSSNETASGTFQLWKGDLLSDALSILPWPSATTTADVNNKAPAMLRAFVLKVEFSVWIPGFARTTFTHPTCLAGVVNSWASVFGSGDLTVPATGLPPDSKLSAFSSLFELAVDTLVPEIGKATSLLINPVDKTNSIPGTVSQIVETTPSVNVQAAIDVGAYIKGVANAATGADPNVNAAIVNVGKVLSSIFALPIAIDVNGITRSRTIIPTVPTALPSIKSLPGSSALGGGLPVGSLNTLIKTDLAGAIFSFESTDSADPMILKAAGPGLNGFRLTPLPRLLPVTSITTPKIKVTVSLPTSLIIPGRSSPLTISISLPPISLTVPTIKVPQLALLLRPYLKDYPAASPDILALIDPYTSNAFRDLGSLNIVQSLVNALSVPAKIFSPQFFAAYNIRAPGVIGTINSLLNGAKTLVDTMTKPGVLIQDQYVPSNQVGSSVVPFRLSDITQEGSTSNSTKWYATTSLGGKPATLMDSNVSTVMYLGIPDLDIDNSYRLRLVLTGDGVATRHFGSLWLPQPRSGVPFIIAVADTDPVANGLGWASPISTDPKDPKAYTENGPENAPSQVQASNKPYWNDQPKLVQWVKGASKL